MTSWRIVHLCRVAPPATGGMEAVIDGLGRAQIAAGHDVRVVTLAPHAPTETPAARPSLAQLMSKHIDTWLTSTSPPPDAGHPLPITYLRRLGPRRYPAAWGLGDVLEGADLVHVHGIDGLADQALSWRARHAPQTRIGISTHGGYLHTSRQWQLKQLWMRTLTRWSLQRADAIWFTSPSDQVAFTPSGLHGKVVPNGVDLSRFTHVSRHPEAGRLLCFGRIDTHKGLHDLLATLHQARGLHTGPWHLDVVGQFATDALERELKTLVQTLGLHEHVTWHGRLEDSRVRELLGRTSLAVFPSKAEGFGLALTELMVSGVPIAARPIPAHQERLGMDGSTGYYIDFDRPRHAAETLCTLRDADHMDVVTHAARRAQTWAWSQALPQWNAAYEALWRAP